jgi:hypothetical protein
MEEHILQIGGLRRLAADAARHAAGAAGGLFTLVAKHLSVSILGGLRALLAGVTGGMGED